MADIIVPHLAIPLRMKTDNKGFTVNEQDSIEDVLDCVETIIRYPRGFRIDSPEFGTPDQVFHDRGANAIEVKDAITEQEPRADVVSEVEQDKLDQLISHVRISVAGEGGPDA
jgi:phage baseplate assembly protein W